jgi:Tol biopolymer transport system component
MWNLIVKATQQQVISGVGLLAILLTSCAPAGQLLHFPFDPGGRGLNSPFSETEPGISKRYLVFTSTRQSKQDIYVFDLETQRLVDLPGLNALDAIASNPAISADGNLIAFVLSRQGQSDIYLYNRGTQQLRNLTDSLNADVRNPSLSSDGNLIAFEMGVNGQWDIALCDRTGQLLSSN